MLGEVAEDDDRILEVGTNQYDQIPTPTIDPKLKLVLIDANHGHEN